MKGPNYRKLQKRERKKLRRLKKEFAKRDQAYQTTAEQREDMNTVYYLTRDEKRFRKPKEKFDKQFVVAERRLMKVAEEIGIYIVKLRKKRKGSRIPIPFRVQYIRQLKYMKSWRERERKKRAKMGIKPRKRGRKPSAIQPKYRYKEIKTTRGTPESFVGFVVARFTCSLTRDYDGFLRGDVVTHFITAHIENQYMKLGEASGPFSPLGMTRAGLVKELVNRHMTLYPNHHVLRVVIDKVVRRYEK